MDNWTLMCPYARLVFGESRSPGFEVELGKMAGVKNKGGIWHVPANAFTVVGQWARDCCVDVISATWGNEPSLTSSWDEIERELRTKGELQDWVYSFFTAYQMDALCFGWNLSGVHFWHPTGSGKSLSGITLALSTPGPVVVITRAASRIQYAREIERFVRTRAYVVRPASMSASAVRVKGETWNDFRARHKGSGYSTKDMGKLWKAYQAEHGIDAPKTLREYILDCYNQNFRPFVVVGWESLSDNLASLCELKPGTVIYDESHRGKNSKRFDVIHLIDLPQDQEKAIALIKQQKKDAEEKGGFIKDTDDGRKMFVPVANTASAAAQLARSAKKRVCTTATPVKDRVRDLWAQLDLAEPNAWGSATSWLDRYCDRKPGIYGGYDTTGKSNMSELNERIKGVAHILAYEETHRQLPAKRRQSVYITPEDQCAPSAGFAAELRAAKARGPTAVLECQLAQAASKKRKAVLDMIEDHVRSKHKVVVFTGRKKDCDELGQDVRKALNSGVTVWSAHGEQSVASRQAIIDEYMTHPGPCVLVGTGHAFGESLNIHDTDAAFFVMLPYTPGQLRQWEGRFTRLGQRRPVVIYYVIAEGTVDEHVAAILIDKLPAVEDIAKDTELARAKDILAGFDPSQTEEDFVASVLADLDFD
jgi:superfamily II DNA or RNA helicase